MANDPCFLAIKIKQVEFSLFVNGKLGAPGVSTKTSEERRHKIKAAFTKWLAKE